MYRFESGIDERPVAHRFDDADDGQPGVAVLGIGEREPHTPAERALPRPETLCEQAADDDDARRPDPIGGRERAPPRERLSPSCESIRPRPPED